MDESNLQDATLFLQMQVFAKVLLLAVVVFIVYTETISRNEKWCQLRKIENRKEEVSKETSQNHSRCSRNMQKLTLATNLMIRCPDVFANNFIIHN